MSVCTCIYTYMNINMYICIQRERDATNAGVHTPRYVHVHATCMLKARRMILEHAQGRAHIQAGQARIDLVPPGTGLWIWGLGVSAQICEVQLPALRTPGYSKEPLGQAGFHELYLLKRRPESQFPEGWISRDAMLMKASSLERTRAI